MKKTILLSACVMCILGVKAQVLVDDAVQGPGFGQHKYVGAGWVHNSTSPTFYKSTLSYSNVAEAYVDFTFEGKRIEWFTEKKNTHGIAAVSIDGGTETFVDLYSAASSQRALVYSQDIIPGAHYLRIRVTGSKNAASTGFYVIHDYFSVTQAATNISLGEGAIQTIGGASYFNSGVGYNAMNTIRSSSSGNTAIGALALPFVSDLVHDNTAIGHQAMYGGVSRGYAYNTAVGAFTFNQTNGIVLTTAVGAFAGAAPNIFVINSTAIGAQAMVTGENQVRIGNEGVTSIGGQVSWSTLSDGRFKRDLKEDVSGLEFVKGLRPVSYTVDKKAIRQFIGAKDIPNDARVETKEIPRRQTGFVAQEVDALVKKSGYIFNGVDVPQNEKDPYTIRYAEFVVPLVKAVQELSAKVEEQEKQIDQLLQKISERESGTDLNSNEISLFQNAPNPFSMNTEIKMALPESVISANVIVYNLEGKQLKEMKVNQRGDATVTIQGNELTAGMYIYALIADGKVIDTKRMILTK